MDETKILMPGKEVRLGDTTCEVNALAWRDALLFIGKISQTIFQQAEFVAGIGQTGLAGLTLDKVNATIAQSADLVEWLLTRTAKVKGSAAALSADAVAAMPVGDVLKLLDAALEVNLSEEVVGLGKSVGGRIAALLPKRPASAPSIPSSSATATPATS